MAASGKYDAVICLGAVIRGATSHYDVVCNEVSKGIAQVQLETGVPVMMGVLTVDTIEQAIERAGTKAGNKGFECGVGAIEMVNLIRQIEAYNRGFFAGACGYVDAAGDGEFSVALRTGVFDGEIGSRAADEYDEIALKLKTVLSAFGGGTETVVAGVDGGAR